MELLLLLSLMLRWSICSQRMRPHSHLSLGLRGRQVQRTKPLVAMCPMTLDKEHMVLMTQDLASRPSVRTTRVTQKCLSVTAKIVNTLLRRLFMG